MNKFCEVVIVISLIVIVFNVSFLGYRHFKTQNENVITFDDNAVPNAIIMGDDKVISEVEPIAIIEDKEVVNSNNNYQANIYEAMVISTDDSFDVNGNKLVKVILVNGNVFDAVFADSSFDINTISMSDEIKFEGEIKENRIYINKVIDVVSFMERA